MDQLTRDELLDLNRTFYQTFAREFSATRQRLQPGVMRVVEQITHQQTILDLGCGNGQLGKALIDRGHKGHYTGLDSNAELLDIARSHLPEHTNTALFYRDLSSSNWAEKLPVEQYDLVLAFAVLHHIPDSRLREHILLTVSDLLPPGARFIHSAWQVLNSPRLKERIQGWEVIGLDKDKVEDGDYLVDWRAGGQGLRYVHIFDSFELEKLAAETGFEIIESFHSDGEGGNLGLYQIWKRL